VTFSPAAEVFFLLQLPLLAMELPAGLLDDRDHDRHTDEEIGDQYFQHS
jgi:hypothetical protein